MEIVRELGIEELNQFPHYWTRYIFVTMLKKSEISTAAIAEAPGQRSEATTKLT